MSGHHRRSVQRAVLNRRVAGAGVAGVAAVFSVAPFAHADPVNADGGSAATAPQVKAPAKAAAGTKSVRAVAVEPNFGFQKIRAGVQVKDGSWVPNATTTAGTQVTITETGPHVGGSGTQTTTCTTAADTLEAGSTATYCEFATPNLRQQESRIAAASGHTTNQIRAIAAADPIPPQQLYTALPGSTVTVTQTTVNANLLIDPVPQTVQPCTLTGNEQLPVCAATQTVLFNDAGLPPAAKNDSLTLTLDKSGVINVLGNDVTKGAPATITIVTQPAHGTASVVGGSAAAIRTLKAPAEPTIKYTPKTGFFGHDSFTYRLTTANGTATARVSVLVTAPPTAHDDTVSTTSGTAVTVDVLANDAANGGTLAISSAADPAHGTATVQGGKIVYTPDSGFVGTDTFTYVASTAGGTDTATVTITVSGSGVANTGGPDDQLIGLAALLLATGGAATVAGRRRYRARHVGHA